MSSLVSNHGSLTITAILVHQVYVLDQFTEDFGVLEMFSLEGLIGQSMYLPSHKIHSSFVFAAQVLVRYGYEESMAPVFSVPSVISQFSDSKSKMAATNFSQSGGELRIQDGGSGSQQ